MPIGVAAVTLLVVWTVVYRFLAVRNKADFWDHHSIPKDYKTFR